MNRVKIGTVINVRGLKGEMKIASSTSFASIRYKKGSTVYLVNHETNEEAILSVAKHSTVSIFDYVIFDEVNTIEEANKYRGFDVEVEVESLHKLDKDTYYFYELEGCNVFDQDNNLLGGVSEVIDSTAQTLIRVKKDDKTFLVPFIKAFIIDVDIENKKIIINKMEGLV